MGGYSLCGGRPGRTGRRFPGKGLSAACEGALGDSADGPAYCPGNDRGGFGCAVPDL